MITNDVQYRTTKSHLTRFDQAATNLARQLDQDPDSQLIRLELAAVRSQADDLRHEIAEYEALKSGEITTLTATSLADVASLLIKARIARGWTQGRLAEALGVAEQQVQRYEATLYRSASLARICDIADALNITITERAELGGPSAA